MGCKESLSILAFKIALKEIREGRRGSLIHKISIWIYKHTKSEFDLIYMRQGCTPFILSDIRN
jgi:hypothetical protein